MVSVAFSLLIEVSKTHGSWSAFFKGNTYTPSSMFLSTSSIGLARMNRFNLFILYLKMEQWLLLWLKNKILRIYISVQRPSSIWGLFQICMGAHGLYLYFKLHIITTMKYFLHCLIILMDEQWKKYFIEDIVDIWIYIHECLQCFQNAEKNEI